MEYPWKRISAVSLTKADAIVVLSGSGIFLRGNEKIIEWGDPDRFIAGVKLYKAGKAPKIIFTAEGKKINSSSGNLYIREASRLGVPKNAMYLTTNVMNTLDEAKAIKVLISKGSKKKTKIILVTSAFHMTRARRIFERRGFAITPFPVDFKSQGDRWFSRKIYNWTVPNADSLSKSSRYMRELLGRAYYKVWDSKAN